MFESQNKAQLEYLRGLSALAAMEAWLEGNFSIGEEPALIFAVRKDQRVVASDDAIMDAMDDAICEGIDAATCLERLASLR